MRSMQKIPEIYFVYGNHNTPEVMEDLFLLIQDFLKYSLDKDLRPSKYPVPGAWNIVVEAMNKEWLDRLVLTKRVRGTRFFCVATEFVTGNTFNLFKKPEVGSGDDSLQGDDLSVRDEVEDFFVDKPFLLKIYSHKLIGFPFRWGYAFFRLSNLRFRTKAFEKELKGICNEKNWLFQSRNTDDEGPGGNSQYEKNSYFRERFQWFKRSLPYFDMIWCMTTLQMEGYRNLLKKLECEDIPVWQLPIQPYQEEFRVDRENSMAEMDIDVLFTGTMTDYRLKVLTRLERKGYRVVYENPDIPSFERKNLFARSKICIHILPHPGWMFSSPMRLHSLLMNRKCTVAELTQERDCIHLDFVEASESAHLIETVEKVLAGFDIKMGEESHARYRNATLADRERIRDEFLGMISS